MIKRLWENEVYSHLLVAFIYFFLVSVLRLVDGGLGPPRLAVFGEAGMLGLWAGAVLGTFFLDIDHLIYWFVTNTEKEDSREAREIITAGSIRGIRSIKSITGRLKGLYGLLKKVHFSHTRLIFHSVLGQAILVILAVYLLTSGGSVFGAGMIMAMNLHLLKDEWTDFFKTKDHLTDWLFWQVKDNGIRKYMREYLIGASLIFLGLTSLLV